MKVFFTLVILLLIIGGLNIIVTSSIPGKLSGGSVEVPLAVALISGGFLFYGAYEIWKNIYGD